MAVFNAVVNDGANRLGRLVDRGAFDPYCAYQPGEVALDDGVAYLNIGAGGGALLGRDTFARPDASRWGVTSDGQEWLPYVQTGQSLLARVLGGRGVLTGQASPTPGAILLLDVAPGGDRELLAAVRWTRSTLNSNTGPQIVFAADTDLQNYLIVSTNRDTDGKLSSYWTTHGLSVTGGSSDPSSFVVADDALVWVRVRGVGSSLTVRSWLDGTPEPEAWDTTATTDGWGTAPRLGLGADLESADDVLGVDYFSARDLSTALTVPSSDPTNWVALAAAFPQAQPY